MFRETLGFCNSVQTFVINMVCSSQHAKVDDGTAQRILQACQTLSKVFGFSLFQQMFSITVWAVASNELVCPVKMTSGVGLN